MTLEMTQKVSRRSIGHWNHLVRKATDGTLLGMVSVPISSDTDNSGLEPAVTQITRKKAFLPGLCIFICNCEKKICL